jgi:hypothetical protein
MQRLSAVILTFCLILPLLMAAGGCSDGRPKRVPASGQVLIDGKPLDYGYVQFSPSDSRPSIGQLDANGHFVLSCFDLGDGAVTGLHKVSVNGQEPIGQEVIKWHAPKKYADPRTSQLTQNITGPTDSIKIELTWGGETGPVIERH